MKLSIVLFLVCTLLLSCSKEITLPPHDSLSAVVSTSIERVQAGVTFDSSEAQTIYLSQYRNTIQTDSFSVSSGPCYISSFLFKITGSPNLVGLIFYINGGQVKARISYSNDSIFVEMISPVTLKMGNYNYILQARTLGASGSSFSTTLNSAIIVDGKKRMINVINLPQVGNNFILN